MKFAEVEVGEAIAAEKPVQHCFEENVLILVSGSMSLPRSVLGQVWEPPYPSLHRGEGQVIAPFVHRWLHVQPVPRGSRGPVSATISGL